jgi:hypothetical protein
MILEVDLDSQRFNSWPELPFRWLYFPLLLHLAPQLLDLPLAGLGVQPLLPGGMGWASGDTALGHRHRLLNQLQQALKGILEALRSKVIGRRGLCVAFGHSFDMKCEER